MKRLHRPNLFGWSVFNEDRNIDFHSVVWVRPEGNVVIDPLPLSDHDEAHLRELGGVAWIVVTNSDHVRDSMRLAENTGAQLMGPSQEANNFPVACTRWLSDGDEVMPGMSALELEGSKTPGELALLLEGSTLITGDLIRAHEGGALCLLPKEKLSNERKAIASLQRLVLLPELEALLPGDGWPEFRNAKFLLRELLMKLDCEKDSPSKWTN
jgi:glyoxylase-like metal-dependent hydrolase (beta-lactamase superfamily II)